MFDAFDVIEIRPWSWGKTPGCTVVTSWGKADMMRVLPAEAFETLEAAMFDAELEFDEAERRHNMRLIEENP